MNFKCQVLLPQRHELSSIQKEPDASEHLVFYWQAIQSSTKMTTAPKGAIMVKPIRLSPYARRANEVIPSSINTELQEKIEKTVSLEAVIEIAGEAGFSITVDDIKSEVEGELSLMNLEQSQADGQSLSMLPTSPPSYRACQKIWERKQTQQNFLLPQFRRSCPNGLVVQTSLQSSSGIAKSSPSGIRTPPKPIALSILIKSSEARMVVRWE